MLIVLEKQELYHLNKKMAWLECLLKLCRLPEQGNILFHPLLISIVTPCFNRAELVSEAVESVCRQDYPHLEHIIIDAGSTDGTLEVLRNYPHLRVYSEPDAGIYDALNKGVKLARGEVVGFLNTDDCYEPGILRLVAEEFERKPNIDALVGGATIFQQASDGKRRLVARFPSIQQQDLLIRATEGAPIFNAWFFRKRVFDELGGFETCYLYVADREFLLRMAFQATSFGSVDKALYHYRMHPGSYTLSGEPSGEDAWMFESRALATRYLDRAGLSRKARKCFKVWHSQIITEQILTAWGRKAPLRMIRYMLAGLRYNPLGWPNVFMKKVIERRWILLDKPRNH
jgi:glycosyltransferase involved in cell wall biosynthesis